MVRNFWIECEIDGKATVLAGGPKAKDKGMWIKLYVRDKGESVKAIDINCFVDSEGKLKIVEHNNENLVDKYSSGYAVYMSSER